MVGLEICSQVGRRQSCLRSGWKLWRRERRKKEKNVLPKRQSVSYWFDRSDILATGGCVVSFQYDWWLYWVFMRFSFISMVVLYFCSRTCPKTSNKIQSGDCGFSTQLTQSLSLLMNKSSHQSRPISFIPLRLPSSKRQGHERLMLPFWAFWARENKWTHLPKQGPLIPRSLRSRKHSTQRRCVAVEHLKTHFLRVREFCHLGRVPVSRLWRASQPNWSNTSREWSEDLGAKQKDD